MPDNPSTMHFQDTFQTFSIMSYIYMTFFYTCCLAFLVLIFFAFLFEPFWEQAMVTLGILSLLGMVFFYAYYSNWASKKLIADQFNCPECGTSRFYRNMIHVPGGGFPTVKGFARLDTVCQSCGHNVKLDA